MLECELNVYNTIDDLYNNLMPKKGKKHPNNFFSFKREIAITQMLIDKLNLKLNEDPKFELGRKLYFYEISYFKTDDKDKDKMKLIQEKKILKKGSSQKEIFGVNGINYTISLEMFNVHVQRKKTQKEMKNNSKKQEDTITLATEKTEQKSKSKLENNFSTSDTQTENNVSFYRRFKDDYEGNHYTMKIIYTSHEVDGNVITLEDIDIRNKLGEILYYPKEDNSKIKNDSKILIEVKQNATLEILFTQMSKLMEDFKIILPKENFYYFGFVNEGNAKNNLNENEFIEKIKITEKQNPNFKVFLFTIKDNKIFDCDLKDNADYTVHFRNEIKNEIEIMKDDTDTKINGLKNEMNEKINGLKNEMNEKINGLKNEINGLKNEINGLKNDMNEKINGLKNDMNDLRYFMTAQFKALSDSIIELKDDNRGKKNHEQNKK